ncbi:MAG TPA: hypothetical protein VK563_21480 [Puia sp.]|nr:hypothetical protein [Puia sp.]
MFRQIFLFELKYRLRRPGIYLCFLAAFGFSFLSFSLGALPAGDKEYLNSPTILAFFIAVTSMMMMLISSAIMGVPLYRDIEYNTRDYYLSYPITKAGYFWGRFAGSFFFILLIAAAIPFGAWTGSIVGPAAGWQEAGRYGPQHLSYYLHPYLTIAIPNLIFTSSLFFGLVAATRNVKVIYSSGIMLFLGYLLSNFILHGTRNMTVINLSDPFGIVPIRLETMGYTLTQKNSSLVSIHGSFLANRLLWPGIGLLILLVIYARFSFEKFFSGKADKKAVPGARSPAGAERLTIPAVETKFTGSYNRKTLFTLTRIEILNIIRDNYFWIILSCGSIFLCFAFANTWNRYNMQDFPSTALLTYIFNDNFLFFVFIILIFYTGETVHREKVTRYAAINDALPPPDGIFGFSRLLSLLVMAAFLALLPVILGMGVQLAKGYTQFNFHIYFTNLFFVTLPLFTAMVLFSYMLHVVINNKFAAHGIGITIWVGLFLLKDSGKLTYLLLLYSYTPGFRWSDMDGIGHILKPVSWFNLYWLLCGGLFLVLAALYFNRGVSTSFRERRQLARERWSRDLKIVFALLLAGFLAVGSYIYYNVSFLNNYLTQAENTARRAIFEKELKHYEGMPLPKFTKIRMNADLFPDERKALVKAWINIANRTKAPIDSILLDGDNLSEYALKYNDVLLGSTSPLSFSRGKFNWWRPQRDDAGYRLYRLPGGLAPGDSALLEISSVITNEGFTNDLSNPAFLYNGTFFNGGLPGLGYDEGDELTRHDDRKKYHLPERKTGSIPHGDPRGTDNLSAGSASDLYSLDIIVSTSGDQTVVAPGALKKEWKENGRNYYQYVQERPGMYGHFAMLSARYAVLSDSVRTEDGRTIPIKIFYHPAHSANLDRFLTACKEGLINYSRWYGPYPFERLSIVETSAYGPSALSGPGLILYSENFGWNANFTDPGQWDFCYAETAARTGGQWWGQQVAPNGTVGSGVVGDGLAEYSSLKLAEIKGGPGKAREALQQELNGYNFGKFISQRRFESTAEKPLLNTDKDYIWKNKASILLYGLGKLMGADSLDAALREFQEHYAFRDHPPFAGGDDLYRVLQRHIPDSLRYYLTDSWEKVVVYDNKVLEASAAPFGKGDQYKVTIKISAGKSELDSAGNEHPAEGMNDYIDVGIFGAAAGRGVDPGGKAPSPLYLARHRFGSGKHTLVIIVHGKPASVGVDPYRWLIDRNPGDNEKKL